MDKIFPKNKRHRKQDQSPGLPAVPPEMPQRAALARRLRGAGQLDLQGEGHFYDPARIADISDYPHDSPCILRLQAEHIGEQKAP